ncbi:hypothetical protein NXF25_018865 [Crotalus adamanteus]|uniref:Uncharacterized protein n=1 Tax=Crotalus adamanteus TaxID=8729 RepID=A0AAW1B0G0_CROAD
MNSRWQIKYKATESGEKAVDFFLQWTRLEEAQNYTCQYHQESNCRRDIGKIKKS